MVWVFFKSFNVQCAELKRNIDLQICIMAIFSSAKINRRIMKTI